MVLITRKNGSGTVQNVVAGQGITVDSTDPANPIVSAVLSVFNPSQFDSIEGGYVYYAPSDSGIVQITRYDTTNYYRMIATGERSYRTTLTYTTP